MRPKATAWIPTHDFALVLAGQIRVHLPEGARISGVREDWQRDGIGLLVSHPDWPEPAPGNMLPPLLATRGDTDLRFEWWQ